MASKSIRYRSFPCSLTVSKFSTFRLNSLRTLRPQTPPALSPWKTSEFGNCFTSHAIPRHQYRAAPSSRSFLPPRGRSCPWRLQVPVRRTIGMTHNRMSYVSRSLAEVHELRPPKISPVPPAVLSGGLVWSGLGTHRRRGGERRDLIVKDFGQVAEGWGGGYRGPPGRTKLIFRGSYFRTLGNVTNRAWEWKIVIDNRHRVLNGVNTVGKLTRNVILCLSSNLRVCVEVTLQVICCLFWDRLCIPGNNFLVFRPHKFEMKHGSLCYKCINFKRIAQHFQVPYFFQTLRVIT